MSDINVVLNKPFFHPGELVQATITVFLSESISKYVKLLAVLKGKERTKFKIVDDEISYSAPRKFGSMNQHLGTVGHQVHTYSLNGKKTLFNLEFLKEYPSGIEKGQHVFTCEFQLPQELPQNSFIVLKDCNDVYKGAVCYKFKATFGDLLFETFVPITSNVIKHQLTDFQEKKFLFGGRGKLKMKIEIAKNSFQPGEIIPINISIRNDSKKNVNSIKVKLFRSTTICCNDKTPPNSSDDLSIERSRIIKKGPIEVNRMQFEGVPRKTQSDRVLNYQVPKKTKPSVNGQFLKIEYFLDIECDVPLAFDLESKPVIEIVYQPSVAQSNIPFFKRLPLSWTSLFSDDEGYSK